MQKKLSDWAKENNMPYKKAWEQVNNGTFPEKTNITKTGRIYVEEAVASQNLPQITSFATPVAVDSENKKIKNLKTSLASDGYRINIPAIDNSTSNQFYHIQSGIEPFAFTTNNKKGTYLNVNWVIYLCQKAYWNFSVVRNIIDTMTDFSVSNIYLRGGNEKSRQFFYDWLNSINILDFEDKFFREYYRSSNSFIYRFESEPVAKDVSLLNKTYSTQAKTGIKLPAKYIILNPTDIGVQANIIFSNTNIFFKRLNGYEINRLRKPQTKEEVNFLNSLPPETQKAIKSGAGSVVIPLDNEKLYAVFYKKQDYEPLAIPMTWPVLRDIEWKSEMKAIDMAVSRTMNNGILLIKMGYESKEGKYMVDQNAILTMQQLFQSESVGKTLVADFTTDAEFIIPAVGDFLDPKKYEIVNEDIRMGLNYVLTGTDTKFANQHIQVKLFVERLRQARETFLINFLIPEIKRIGDLMGFKSYPIPYFEDIDLKDAQDFNKIVTRLAEIGLLTPSETFKAIETGRIPTGEESLIAQQEFKSQKDKGYYQPIVGGPYNQLQTAKLKISQQPTPTLPNSGGRPSGSKTPQTTKKIGSIKASSEQYSLTKVKDNLILATQLQEKVEKTLLKKHKLKSLSEEQVQIAKEIKEVIVANEKSSEWINKINEYVENPANRNEDQLREIDEISAKHGLDNFTGSILFHSKKE